jgi:hypothetical protein
MTVSIEIWHKQKLHDDFDYEPEVNQMEAIETFVEWLEALRTTAVSGESVTIIARRV